jgi:hypothetical protein
MPMSRRSTWSLQFGDFAGVPRHRAVLPRRACALDAMALQPPGEIAVRIVGEPTKARR